MINSKSKNYLYVEPSLCADPHPSPPATDSHLATNSYVKKFLPRPPPGFEHVTPTPNIPVMYSTYVNGGKGTVHQTSPPPNPVHCIPIPRNDMRRNPSGQRQVRGTYTYAANSLLSTVDFSVEDIRKWAILDSGATSHFLVPEAPVTNVRPAMTPLRVTIPDGNQVSSTHTCELQIPGLPKRAREGHIIPGLCKHSLISVVQLCNAGCDVIMTKIGATVKYRGRIILEGSKSTTNGLWFVRIASDNVGDSDTLLIEGPSHAPLATQGPTNWPATHQFQANLATHMPTYLAANVVSHQHAAFSMIPTSSHAQLVVYHHQSLGSCAASTLLEAI